MGSSISKGKRYQETAIYGEMYAQTDKAGYSAGDTVTGHIYVNILTPYPAKKLLLRLKGTEIVDLVLQKSKRKTAVEKYYTDKNIIINLTVPVLDCPPVIQGQYAIPFAFIVPEHLPSSFHQEGQRYLANISYRLEAILEPKNPKETPKLKYKQDLIVRRSTSKVTSLDNQTLIRTPISTCYCLRRGSNILSVSLEKHLYSPGEVIQAKICLDNTNCKLDNLSISFRLKQKLRLKIKNKKFQREFIKLEDQKAGVQKGQTTQNLSFLLKLPSFQEGDYQLTKRDHMQSLLLSLKENNNVITSATKSKFISSEYFLEVSCPMAGRHCPTTLTRVYPIEIYHPDIRLPSVVAPSNWHPIQLKTANVSFASPAEVSNLPYLTSSIEMGQNTMGIRKLDDEQGRQLQSQFNLDQKAQPQYVQT